MKASTVAVSLQHFLGTIVVTCLQDPAGKVHVGDDGTIFDASLNQSQVAKNNNKVSTTGLLPWMLGLTDAVLSTAIA